MQIEGSTYNDSNLININIYTSIQGYPQINISFLKNQTILDIKHYISSNFGLN